MGETIAAIQIVSVPKGEAPLHIRQAWVGLTLPLAVPAESLCMMVGGVLTAPRTVFGTVLRLLLGQGRRERGYIVAAQAAVDILARGKPEAARWWRENTPHLLAPGRQFVFDSQACREVMGAVWPPPPTT